MLSTKRTFHSWTNSFHMNAKIIYETSCYWSYSEHTNTQSLTMNFIPKGLNLLAASKPKALLKWIQNILCFQIRIYTLYSHLHSQNTETILFANVSEVKLWIYITWTDVANCTRWNQGQESLKSDHLVTLVYVFHLTGEESSDGICNIEAKRELRTYLS